MLKILVLNALLYGFVLTAEPEDQKQRKRGILDDGWVGIPNPHSYGHGQPWSGGESPWKPIKVHSIGVHHQHHHIEGWNHNDLSIHKSHVPFEKLHEKPIIKTFPVYITKHVVVPQPVYVREKVPVYIDKPYHVPVQVPVPIEKIIHKAVPIAVPIPQVVPLPLPFPFHPHFPHPAHSDFHGNFYPSSPYGFEHGYGHGHGHGHGYGFGYGHGHNYHGHGHNHHGHGHDDHDHYGHGHHGHGHGSNHYNLDHYGSNDHESKSKRTEH